MWGGVRIRQSDSDFNERGNNLAGGRKWAQSGGQQSASQCKHFKNHDYSTLLIKRLFICIFTHLYFKKKITRSIQADN